MVGRRQVDWVDAAILAAFVALSAAVVAYNLVQAHLHHLVWTGAGGYYPGDVFQYLAWIRDSAHHVLASDRFTSAPTSHDYLEPLVVVAALITRLGVPPWVTLLALQPVAVVALFFAVRAFVRTVVSDRWAAHAALVLALFFGTRDVLGDEWIPFLTWGYLPAAFSIAALAAGLVSYRRASRGEGPIWHPAILGLLASWLHPWQGEEFIVIVVVLALVDLARSRERRSRLLLPACSLVAAVGPLLYYGALSQLDPSWQMAQRAGALPWSFGSAVWPLLPLAAVGLLALRRDARAAVGPLAPAWILATVVVWSLTSAGLGAAPLHAFGGVTVPLAVCAAAGVQSLIRSRRAAAMILTAGSVACGTLAAVTLLNTFPGAIGPTRGASNLVTHAQARAIDFVAEHGAGKLVVAPTELAATLPALTDARTYYGHPFWSVPDPSARAAAIDRLLHAVSFGAAQREIRAVAADEVIADCDTSGPSRASLAASYTRSAAFGCVHVYFGKPAAADPPPTSPRSVRRQVRPPLTEHAKR